MWLYITYVSKPVPFLSVTMVTSAPIKPVHSDYRFNLIFVCTCMFKLCQKVSLAKVELYYLIDLYIELIKLSLKDSFFEFLCVFLFFKTRA